MVSFGCELALGANRNHLVEFLELIPGAIVLSYLPQDGGFARARIGVPDAEQDSFIILTEDDEMFTSIWTGPGE